MLIRPSARQFGAVSDFRRHLRDAKVAGPGVIRMLARAGARYGGAVLLETLLELDVAHAMNDFARIAPPFYEDGMYLRAIQRWRQPKEMHYVVTADSPAFGHWNGRRVMVEAIFDLAAEQTDCVALAGGSNGEQHTWVMLPDNRMVSLTERGVHDAVVIPEELGGGLLALSIRDGLVRLGLDCVKAENYNATNWRKVLTDGLAVASLDLRFEGNLLIARCREHRFAVLDCTDIRNHRAQVLRRGDDAIMARPCGRIALGTGLSPLGLFQVSASGGRMATIIGPLAKDSLPHRSIAAVSS